MQTISAQDLLNIKHDIIGKFGEVSSEGEVSKFQVIHLEQLGEPGYEYLEIFTNQGMSLQFACSHPTVKMERDHNNIVITLTDIVTDSISSKATIHL